MERYKSLSQPSGNADWRSMIKPLIGKYEFVFKNKLFTDVCFIVGKEERRRINANKVILSIVSPVFETMFSERWSSKNNEIEVPDIQPAAFEELLRFIYCEDVYFTRDTAWSILYAAKKYDVEVLRDKCCDYFKWLVNYDADCVLGVLREAEINHEESLVELCLEIMDTNVTIIDSQDIRHISLELLCSILERDTLQVEEINLFRALQRWTEAECKRRNVPAYPVNKQALSKKAISLIRFPLMTVDEYVHEVVESGLLQENEQLPMFFYYHIVPKPPTKYNTKPRCDYSKRITVIINRKSENDACGVELGELKVYPFSNTIDDIKYLIQMKEYADPLDVFYKGKKLLGNRTPYHYGITEGSELYVTPDLNYWAPFLLEINIRISTKDICSSKKKSVGRKMPTISVYRDDNVRKIKLQIQNLKEIPPHRQKLICDGRHLDDDFISIWNLGINEKSIIQLLEAGSLSRKPTSLKRKLSETNS